MGKESTCMQEMLETWVQFLGWEDPNQEGMAIDSIILAWRILWTEEPGRLQSIGHKELDTSEVTEHARSHACIALGLWIWGWGLAVWWQ